MNTTTTCAPGKPILALGELLVDLVPGREGLRIDEEGPVLKTASGSAGIFACAAAQLGARSGFIGKIGKDSLSRMVSNVLEKQGVDLSHLVVSDEGQIGVAFIEYAPQGRHYEYYRRNSVGSTLSAEELDTAYIRNAYVVHYPGMLLSLTASMRSACEKMVETARQSGVLVSFDPNIRVEIGRDEEAMALIRKAVSQADIVSPSLTEGQMITGCESIGDIVRCLHSMGPRVVALTRDKDGAVLSIDGMCAFADGVPEAAVDPTGAGDTYAAALCVGLQEGMPLEKLSAFCNCAGTICTMKQGVIGVALPTRADVEKMMASSVSHVHMMPLSEVR